MKRMLSLCLVLLMTLVFTVGAQAYTLQWISESKDYAVGDTVGSWEVLNYKDAVAGNSNGVWTTSGIVSGGTRSNGATIMYFFYGGSYAEVTLGAKSTAVAFMLESDDNDKLVNFYVDGELVLGNYDMLTLPKKIDYPNWQVGTLVISGLSDSYHKIKIQSVDSSSDRDDFHMYGGAAVAASSVPEPATLLLLGLGLLGLVPMRKRLLK